MSPCYLESETANSIIMLNKNGICYHYDSLILYEFVSNLEDEGAKMEVLVKNLDRNGSGGNSRSVS